MRTVSIVRFSAGRALKEKEQESTKTELKEERKGEDSRKRTGKTRGQV
jgi:hypothetical protein